MTRVAWVNITTITLFIITNTWTVGASIPTYTITNMCNQTISIDPSGILMGVLNFWYSPTTADDSSSVCRVSLQTTPRSNLGLQFLTSAQLPDCASFVYIRRLYCAQNTTLHKEITISSHEAVVDFFVNITELKTRSDPVQVSVLFYTFSAVDVFGSCIEAHADMQMCEKSGRCLYKPLFNYLDQYDMCQSVPTKPPRITTENYIPETVVTSYTGVAVFVSSLFFLLAMLVLMQFVSRRQLCRKCRECLGLPVQETSPHRAAIRDARRRRQPEFTLGPESAPPPNYSDLSFHNGVNISSYQDAQETTSTSTITSSNAAQIETGVQTEISVGSQIDFTAPASSGRHTRRGTSAGNVSNTGSLPPSYSEVVIHQEKYHVHNI